MGRKSVWLCAVLAGHVEIVQWLHATRPSECPADIFSTARHVPVLEVLHQAQVARLSADALWAAIFHRRWEVVEWLVDHGCPWSDECVTVLLQADRRDLAIRVVNASARTKLKRPRLE